MKMIEPCCYPKHLGEFFNDFEKSSAKTNLFTSNSDWTFAQLVQWIVWLMPSGTFTIMLKTLTEHSADALITLLERQNCAVGCAPKPLIGRLNLILPKPVCAEKYIIDFVSKYKDRVSLAYADSMTEMFLLESENADKYESANRYSIVADFNQSIDKKFRVFTVCKSVATYNEYKKIALSFLRIHHVLGVKDV